MKFLPAENIIYKTRLKEDELIRRLSDYIEPEKTFRFGVFGSGSTKSYEGQISGQAFNIKRIISYRNSFLPRINGVIERDFDGLTIKVKMRLHIFVIVFLCIWCGGVGLGCLAFLMQAFSKSEFNPATIIPFGMLIFAYALTMGAFKFESNKSKKDLQTIFEAHIIEV
ncbi:hypothetical protein [Nubsella zeaxanthinifaciens]|uniref:hypothetical protein n=1 Tax=Nubsella zeaxanthinifaciens TaxID=392412 RepID=UPI000DE2B652|nr:hypothetical protein [Nubsella zeaxanthinifaciens]